MNRLMAALTWRQLKLNRHRTLITLFGVVISVAMITAVSSFSASIQDMFQHTTIDSSGDWHVQYTDVSREMYAEAQSESHFSDVFLIERVANDSFDAPLGRLFECCILAYDDAAFEFMPVHLIEGVRPSTSSECVISSYFAQKLGVSTGDSVVICDRTMVVTGLTDPKSDGVCAFVYVHIDDDYTPLQTTLSGRLARPSVEGLKWASSYRAQLGATKYDEHTRLLCYMGVVRDDALNAVLFSVVITIMVIIVAASVLLIYNAFAISVTDRTAQFGVLSSLGATARQIKASVRFEALLIALLSIPIGMAFGYIGIGITFRIVSQILRGISYVRVELRLVIDPASALIAVGLSLVTTLFSAWRPARRAAKISPMEAVRRTQDIRLQPKDVRAGRRSWVAFFGFEAEIALRSVRRNRKRYRITLLSTVTSLVLFMSAYGFAGSMRDAYSMADTSLGDYNIMMSARVAQSYGSPSEAEGRPLDQTYLDQYRTSVEQMTSDEQVTQFIYDRNTFTELLEGTWRYTDSMKRIVDRADFAAVGVKVVALSESTLAKLADACGVDPAILRDVDHPAGIVFNHSTFKSNGTYQESDVLDLTVGQTLSLRHEEAQHQRPAIVNEGALTVAALADPSMLMGIKNYANPNSIQIVVSEEVYFSVMAPRPLAVYADFYINASDPYALSEGLMDVQYSYNLAYLEGQYQYTTILNLDEEARASRMVILIIEIFVYGFVGLLALIGVANIVGTLFTSMMLRRRELAMLQSVGLSPKGYDRMMLYENVFYASKTLLYGLPLGIGATLLIYSELVNSFNMAFTLPWKAIAIGSVGVLLTIFLTISYTSRRMKNDVIVDELRTDIL